MIRLKTDSEIDVMMESCQLAARVLDMIEPYVKPGVSTLELNDICHEYIISKGAKPAPLNYKGFPKSICTSVNNVVCHGIPVSKDKLKDGDIINIDITTILKGYHGDTSRTFYVGNVSEKARRLVETTRECLYAGIEAVHMQARIGDIGAAIQKIAEAKGFSVVREYVGHGIGKIFHEDPQIPHYGVSGRGSRLGPGMVFTIEPMINEGQWKTRLLADQWTAVTTDGKLSAQFEHTIGIKSSGEVIVMTELRG